MYLLYFKDHIDNVAREWDSTKFYQYIIGFPPQKKKK